MTADHWVARLAAYLVDNLVDSMVAKMVARLVALRAVMLVALLAAPTAVRREWKWAACLAGSSDSQMADETAELMAVQRAETSDAT